MENMTNFEKLYELSSVNLTFMRVLKSYCEDETRMGKEIKDVVVALKEMIPRQEEALEIISGLKK